MSITAWNDRVSMVNGADLLAAELRHKGVEWISTLCGNGLFSLYASCVKAGIRLIDFRNEQGAAYAAEAFARLTGRVGVCAVSSGVAHNNALTGIANAYFDGAPVLLLTGTSPGYGAGRGVFQEFDQVALAKPICKYASEVNRVCDLAFKIREAFSAATSGRPGPVHLTVTQDVFDGQVKETKSETYVSATQLEPTLGPADAQNVHRIAKLLKSSERPLLIAGTNLFYAGPQPSMMRLCETASIPIVVPIWDRGVIEKAHPNFLGVVGAASGQPRLLPDADFILLAGARVDYRTGFLVPPAVRGDVTIVRVDIDPQQLEQGIQPTIGVLADPDAFSEQLIKECEALGGCSHEESLREARERGRRFQASMTGPTPKPGAMTGRHVVEAIFTLLTDDTVFLIDGGNIGQWAHMLTDRYPSTWLTCGASGVVGWGLPAAIGAKLAYPDRKVLLLSGDGAFGFTLGELEAATRQGIPFVAVVAVDEAWGIVVTTQRRLMGEKGVIASRFAGKPPARYDEVAKALGADGVRVEDPAELSSAIRQGFAADRPTVIHVPIQAGGPTDR